MIVCQAPNRCPLALEEGIGGFRGLRFSGDDLKSPDIDVGTSPYVGITVNFRPSLQGW